MQDRVYAFRPSIRFDLRYQVCPSPSLRYPGESCVGTINDCARSGYNGAPTLSPHLLAFVRNGTGSWSLSLFAVSAVSRLRSNAKAVSVRFGWALERCEMLLDLVRKGGSGEEAQSTTINAETTLEKPGRREVKIRRRPKFERSIFFEIWLGHVVPHRREARAGAGNRTQQSRTNAQKFRPNRMI
mmetsp:Transcript_36085/g.107956  ORF Transcript_36085/g.107956 Transcript_36085/m.107956 type:complete len:185 (-) Transcript_36085:97-651(-)